MAIPNEFSFADEEEFIQRFLLPLLHRLGYSIVANYHGQSEFGKDLVFGEVDRFGHIRFNAIQAKFLPSISLNAIEDLILDCSQAFANEFRHPQTGSLERISCFYAINGGSISDQAVQHFFSSLMPRFGGNVRLLQAKDLLVLDRYAITLGRNSILEKLTGLKCELRFNERQVKLMNNSLASTVSSRSRMFIFPRVKGDATSAFLTAPAISDAVLIDLLEQYWCHLSLASDLSLLIHTRGLKSTDLNEPLHDIFKRVFSAISITGSELEIIVDELIAKIGG